MTLSLFCSVFSLSESADFDTTSLKTALERGIEIPEDRGANIGAAFKTIHDEGFNALNGWRKNDQIPSVLIVLTDNLNTVDFYDDLQYVHSNYQDIFNPCGKSDQLVARLNFAKNGWAKRS